MPHSSPRRPPWRWLFCFALIAASWIAFPVGDGGRVHGAAPEPLPLTDPNSASVIGVTVPSEESRLAAVFPARIARITAAEGTDVAEGELVVELDHRVQRARMELAKAASESTSSMELSRVRWEHARREWDRLTTLHGSDYASSKELSDAFANAEIKRLEHDSARHEHEQALRAYDRERAQWEEYSIRAPFAGYISQHFKHRGETVDQLEPIVTLVRLDPLHVVADCPTSLALSVHCGDRIWVQPFDSRWSARVGTVVLVNRVADGASQTFRLKLSVPNEDGLWLSGLKVAVHVGYAVNGPYPSRMSFEANAAVRSAGQRETEPK